MAVADFQRAFQRVIDGLGSFASSLSQRDRILVQLGMRTSHIEEAIAVGDSTRASAHLQEFGKLLQQFQGPVHVEIANTPAARSQGLMNRVSLPANQGMLFVFPNRADHRFWMHNVRFPLDIVFFDGNRVAGVLENVPAMSNELRLLGIPSIAALEVNAGWARAHGIHAGQTASLSEDGWLTIG